MKIRVLLYDQLRVKFWHEELTLPVGSDVYAALWDKFGSLTVEWQRI